MKHFYRISPILSLVLLTSFLCPGPIMAQKAELEVDLFVSCVQDLGNDTLVAWFGYENPNQVTVTVQEKKSFIAYNYSRDIKYINHIFEPGVHTNVYSQKFRSDDWVRWTVKFSGYTKIVRADLNSQICDGELDIIPYYAPPEGGKVDHNSLIGAELTSLYLTYIYYTDVFIVQSDNIYQLRENPGGGAPQVFIEVVS